MVSQDRQEKNKQGHPLRQKREIRVRVLSDSGLNTLRKRPVEQAQEKNKSSFTRSVSVPQWTEKDGNRRIGEGRKTNPVYKPAKGKKSYKCKSGN